MAIRLSSQYRLEDLALKTGATVEYGDGRKFNTTKIRGRKVAKQQESEPSPPQEPIIPAAEPRQEFTAEMFQQLLALLNRPVEVRLPEIPAPQVTVATPEQPTSKQVSWSFEFERNPNGTIKRISATPIKE